MVIQRKRAGKGTQVFGFGFGAGFAAAGAALPLILSLMQASTMSVRLSSGRSWRPCSVAIQHSSAAWVWVIAGFGAGAAGAGALVGLAAQPASAVASSRTARARRRAVKEFIAVVWNSAAAPGTGERVVTIRGRREIARLGPRLPF